MQAGDDAVPVVGQGELGQQVRGIVGRRVHGSHTGCVLTAAVLQESIVQGLLTHPHNIRSTCTKLQQCKEAPQPDSSVLRGLLRSVWP